MIVMIRTVRADNLELDKRGHRLSIYKSIKEYVKRNFKSEKDEVLNISDIHLTCSGCPNRIESIANSVVVKMWSNEYNTFYYRLLTEKTEEEYELYKQRVLAFELRERGYPATPTVWEDDPDDPIDVGAPHNYPDEPFYGRTGTADWWSMGRITPEGG